jgi:hypothetical protein
MIFLVILKENCMHLSNIGEITRITFGTHLFAIDVFGAIHIFLVIVSFLIIFFLKKIGFKYANHGQKYIEVY